MLKQDGHGDHEDLHGLDRQSVIRYVHGGMGVVVLLCVVLI
jgi:hypothetical protein